MKVTMTQKELSCNKFRERYKKNWEHYCIAGDAYLAGYRQAREDASEHISSSYTNPKYQNHLIPDALVLISEDALSLGDDKTEVEFEAGSHQIGQKSTDKEQE